MRKTKILSVLLVIMMLVSMIPTSVFANDSTGGVVTIDEDFSAGELQSIIETSLSTDPATITTLNIVASSGELNSTDLDYIEDNMTSLQILNVAETITVGGIGDNFFDYNTTIQSVTMPATSFGYAAFNHCSALTSVSLPSATTFAGYAFEYCDVLTSISLPAVTTFGDYAFYNCTALTTVELPNATTFGTYAFFNCTALTTVELLNATTFGEYAFRNCNVLENVSLPSAITFGGYAFYNCDALTSISLPAATTFGAGAFYGCDALTTVSCPLATTFGDGAFINCVALTTIELPAATTFGYNLCYGCTALTTVELLSATTFGDAAFKGCTSLTSVTLPAAETFASEAFSGCSVLTTASLPNATTFGSGAFSNCEALTTIELPSATTFGYNLCYNCAALTTVSLPIATTFGVNAFNNCTSLTSVTLPAAETFDNNAFSGCSALTTVDMANATTFGYNAFMNCDLTSVSLPSATTFGSGAFGYNSNLVTISLPSATTFAERAFRNCDSLESVSLTSPSLVFGDNTFAYDTTTIALTLCETTNPTATSTSFNEYDVTTYNSYIVVPTDMEATYDGADGTSDGYWYTWLINPHTVTFNSNGGSAVDSDIVSNNNLATEPTAPTKDGYTFANWFANIELTDAWDFDTDVVTADTTLYAKWLGQCSVTYDGNGNTGGTVPVDGNTYTEGDTVTVLDNIGPLTKTGYFFLGWNTEPNGSGAGYIADDTFEISENTTLYAIWNKCEYNVTYYTGTNGSFSGIDFSSIAEMVYYLESPDEVPTVIADEGYEFLYWEVNPVPGGMETPRMPQYVTTEQIEAMEVTSDIGFTAIYEALDQYTVTFDSNGGSAVSSQTVYDGDKATEPTEPTKEGYIFNGWWYDGSEASGLWDFNENTVTEDMTLHADWIVDTSGSTDEVQKGNITLTLKDSNGNPLAYYPVELHSTVIKATTDANGQVTFSDVTLENHELVVFDKEGNELGTINLNMSASDTNSTSINGNDVAISFNESAVSIDIEIFVEDDGSLTVKEVEINANPKTGATETAIYVGEGSTQFNIIPYLCIILTVLLIGSVFVVDRKQVKR